MQAGQQHRVPRPRAGREGQGRRAPAAPGVGRPGRRGRDGLGRRAAAPRWPAGQVTSAAWGESVGGAVGLAYLRDPAGVPVTPGFVLDGRYEVNVDGCLVPAAVGLRPPYDPDGKKIRST
ncbi:MAG: glycine cleavage T C-terminal barrel domain-containing protein [Streptosporangiaceae bacterium]